MTTAIIPRECKHLCAAPIEVFHVKLNEDGTESGYCTRKRYRTHKEIYWDIHKLMNVSVCKCGHEWKPKKWDSPCPKCKDEGDNRISLIDEYDSNCVSDRNENDPILSLDYEISSIACFCEPGGNEGMSVYVAVLAYHKTTHEKTYKYIYRIKSFCGFDHCEMLVNRLQKILGVRQLCEMSDSDKKKFKPKED